MYVIADDNESHYVAERVFDCDYSLAVPCANQGIDGVVDTTSLNDGEHTIRLAAGDASNEWHTAESHIFVDNHAPANVRA